MLLVIKVWCGRRDSNSHTLRHQNLNLACLPIPPRPHTFMMYPKIGVDDGARTHDHRNHNPGLYQLSYTHHCVHLDRLLGAPSRARTCNLRLRRPLLYPIELWAPNVLPDLTSDWMEVVICEEVRILRPDLQVVNTLFYFFKHFFWF